MFISVVLPAPFSPSSPRTSPACRVRSTERLACTAPKRLSMPRNSSSGADPFMDRWAGRADRPIARARRDFEGRSGASELFGLRRALVDRHPEGSFHDLLSAFGDHVLDFVRQLVLPGVIGRQVRAAFAHEREL